MSRLHDALTAIDQNAPVLSPPEAPPDLLTRDVRVRRRPVLAPVLGAGLLLAVGLVLVVVPPRGVGPKARHDQSPVGHSGSLLPTTAVEADGPLSSPMRQGLEAARAGALDEAARLFERALQLNPADPEGWNNLGAVRIRQREVRRGLEALRRALRLDPAHAEAHRNLAVALERQEAVREAVRHYQSFLALSAPDHPDRPAVRRRLQELKSRTSRE